MPVKGTTKLNLRDLEEKAREAKLKAILYGNPNSSKRIQYGTQDAPKTGLIGDFLNGIEKILEDQFDQVIFDSDNNIFGSMTPKFEHELTIQRGNFIRLYTRCFISIDGGDESHPLFYWLDQGVPATIFPTTTPAFLMQDGRRTGPNLRRNDQPAPKSGLFFFRAGDTRAAIPGNNWSADIAENINPLIRRLPDIVDWEISIENIRFSGES